jgi:hypothetical protein
MGHSAGFGYVLRAIVQDLVCAMGSNKGFGYAIWAIAPKQLPERRSYLKACHIIKRGSNTKKVYVYKQ